MGDGGGIRGVGSLFPRIFLFFDYGSANPALSHCSSPSVVLLSRVAVNTDFLANEILLPFLL